MVRRRFALFALVAVVACMLSGCAGPNSLEDTPDKDGDVAGFWHGLFQGFFIVPIFILSLIFDSVNIYEVHNSGGWYNLGYFLGIIFLIIFVVYEDD